MALVYHATPHPTKLEPLAAWLPTRSWYTEPAGDVERVAEGDPTMIVTPTVELAVVRRLPGAGGAAGPALTGTWDGQAEPLPLAYAVVTAG